MQLDPAGLDLRQVEDAVDEIQQMAGVGLDPPEVEGVLGAQVAGPVLQQDAGETEDGVHRGAQLVEQAEAETATETEEQEDHRRHQHDLADQLEDGGGSMPMLMRRMLFRLAPAYRPGGARPSHSIRSAGTGCRSSTPAPRWVGPSTGPLRQVHILRSAGAPAQPATIFAAEVDEQTDLGGRRRGSQRPARAPGQGGLPQPTQRPRPGRQAVLIGPAELQEERHRGAHRDSQNGVLRLVEIVAAAVDEDAGGEVPAVAEAGGGPPAPADASPAAGPAGDQACSRRQVLRRSRHGPELIVRALQVGELPLECGT